MEQAFKSRNLFSKIRTAFYGMVIPYKTEVSIRIQSTLVFAAVLLGIYLQLNRTDWILLIVAAALLLITECLNTAIEKLVDFVSPGYHELAGRVKDIAAGAVFLAGTAAALIAAFVFLPYFNR